MSAIMTNDRFDKLTNLDISTHYRDREYWLMKSDFMGAFAYWVVVQSPYPCPDISSPLSAFYGYLAFRFRKNLPVQFTYDELNGFINEEAFASMPAIMALNVPKISSGEGYDNRHAVFSPDYDFIDLGALASNVFYMLMRKQITQS